MGKMDDACVETMLFEVCREKAVVFLVAGEMRGGGGKLGKIKKTDVVVEAKFQTGG